MDKGFNKTCPFCFREIDSAKDTCPYCGQKIGAYMDDLGPIMDKIQNATNIDMKSTKARVSMVIIVCAMLAAVGILVIEYMDNMEKGEDRGEMVIDVATNGYIVLDGEFTTKVLSAQPIYDPTLGLKVELNKSLSTKYVKIVWVVKTDWYNSSNPGSPFYLKVTKEREKESTFSSVVWGSLDIGNFTVIADCYTDQGLADTYVGKGSYYGKLNEIYSWEYGDTTNIVSFSLDVSQSEKYLKVDIGKRVEYQNKKSYLDYVSTDEIKELESKLRSNFNRYFEYSKINYADYLLSFVQSCFPNVGDVTNYGTSDYWAYPSELILKRCGDDEDRAILCCSLFKCAGFECGFLSLPGAVVSMAKIIVQSGELEYDVIQIVNSGKKFVAADVDSDKRIGLLRDCYAIGKNGKTFFFNGEDVTQSTKVIIR